MPTYCVDVTQTIQNRVKSESTYYFLMLRSAKSTSPLQWVQTGKAQYTWAMFGWVAKCGVEEHFSMASVRKGENGLFSCSFASPQVPWAKTDLSYYKHFLTGQVIQTFTAERDREVLENGITRTAGIPVRPCMSITSRAQWQTARNAAYFNRQAAEAISMFRYQSMLYRQHILQ